MSVSILGLNIKRIREEKGISAYKLSKDAGVGGATISEIESGKRQSLNTNTIAKIATILNVSTDELFSIKKNIKYDITDIEKAINSTLALNDLVIDGVKMSEEEKLQLKMATDIAINSIRRYREFRKSD